MITLEGTMSIPTDKDVRAIADLFAKPHYYKANLKPSATLIFKARLHPRGKEQFRRSMDFLECKMSASLGQREDLNNASYAVEMYAQPLVFNSAAERSEFLQIRPSAWGTWFRKLKVTVYYGWGDDNEIIAIKCEPEGADWPKMTREKGDPKYAVACKEIFCLAS